MKFECRHIMQSGQVCQAYALRDDYFCYFHSRLHRAAKQPVSLTDSFDIPLLEDRCAVQLTITRVLRAFVKKTIDRQSASTLLYGLQLALQSVDHSSWAIGLDTVESLSQTPDGDEIALGPDEDPDDDEDEIEDDKEEGEEEDDKEEEAPSQAASNSHHEAAGDSGDEDDSKHTDDEENENESTEQLTATLSELQSVQRALDVGDLRPLRACLASAADG
jgi:hypothetical protein